MKYSCLFFGGFVFVIVNLCLIFSGEGLSDDCRGWGRISVKRTSLKLGFHKDILTDVHWSVDKGFTNGNCSILLAENIPGEMFIDLDEIQSQNLTKVIPLSSSSIDVEKPSHLSTEHKILVYGNKIITQVLDGKVELSSTIILPVHWRYQKATQSDYYVNVSLPPPSVLGKCEGTIPYSFQQCLRQLRNFQYPCDYNTMDLCRWFVLIKDVDDAGVTINYTIPVGVQDHTILVTTCTVLVTVFACIFIVRLQAPHPPKTA